MVLIAGDKVINVQKEKLIPSNRENNTFYLYI